MDGRVVEVLVAPGDPVEAGQCLVVIEAMKLESHVLAPAAGKVEELRVRAGDQVTFRQVLAVVSGG